MVLNCKKLDPKLFGIDYHLTFEFSNEIINEKVELLNGISNISNNVALKNLIHQSVC